MASKKSKILAIAFCAAVMSGIYANPALAIDVWNNDTLGYQEGTTTTTTGTTLKNPEIHHQEEGFEIPGGSFDRPVHENGDEACEESADRITIGDINKVKNDLVDNDKQNAEAIDNLETKVDGINEAIESGALKGEQGEKGEDGKDGQDGKDGVDGKDGASIASGEYNVQDGTGIVQMPIEDEDGNKVGDVQINNIASQNDLKDETVAREEGDKAVLDEVWAEADERREADNKLTAEIDEESVKRQEGDKALQDEIWAEADERREADNKLTAEIDEESVKRQEGDQALQDNINAVESQSKDRDEQLQANIDAEEQARKDADDALQADINAKEEQSKDRDEQLQANIDAEEQARKDADDALQADINAKEEQSKYRDEQLQQSIDIQREVIGADSTEDLQNAYSGTNYISDAENMVEADRKLDAAISDVNSRVDGIENRVDGLEDRIDKVGAMSAAIANLRTMGYDPAAPTEVAVGVGQYRDETGMALGLFHYPNRDFMLSLSVSTSGDEYMGGIGATWKFGRKSPEKVAEIKKAQAEADARRAEEQKLAKAEEMKKAAKEAKVQAQMERHAKLAAERAALEEA